ncbi:MAG TPA: hypothetical protein VJ508_16830 [Saprospiraceae bacterium]|nr:hypothetical protein [Saprospiraceae bacterium]
MKIKVFLLVLSMISFRAIGQDQINAFITEAQGYLANKDYKNAQLSLTDAINEINNLVAQQVAQMLPKTVNGLSADGEGQVNTAGMGMMGGGITITQNYKNPTKPENTAEVQIMANSPMLATMNMALGNPAMMGQGYKSVRVGSHRTIMKTEMQDFTDDNNNSKQIRSSEIQIPLSTNLITINARGFATEADELAFANKLDIDKVIAALGN